MTVADATCTLSGDSVAHVPRGVAHTLANARPGGARLLIVQSAPGADRYSAQAAALIANSTGSPDPGRMHALAEEHHIHFQE